MLRAPDGATSDEIVAATGCGRTG
ncbi:MAG: hypothetical protein ACK4KW_12390 [Gemmobacter sp.]